MAKCFYRSCTSSKRSTKGSLLLYHPFPKPIRDMARCLIWLNNCGNEKLNINNISKNVYICEKHFNHGDDNPVPYYAAMQQGDARQYESFEVGEYVEVANQHATTSGQCSSSEPSCTNEQAKSFDHNYSKHAPPSSSICVQLFSKLPTVTNKQDFFLYSTFSKSKHFQFFTGLSVETFEVLYKLLDEKVMPSLKYSYKSKTPIQPVKLRSFSDRDKLCLTLIRLRRGYTLKELSIFYNFSIGYISVIFYTWVQFIYLQTCFLRNDLFKGSRRTEKNQMPVAFRLLPKKVTVILDSTEVRMQMSSNFQRQGNTHSNYKHYNTVKFLVGISCRGAIIYNSEGYEGSISDVDLFRSCDLQHFLEEGDVLMVDRGFTIQELCHERKYQLLIPPFLSGRTRLTGEEEAITKRIAKCRIHVERAIQRIKAYQILSRPLKISMLPLVSNIFSIICFLVNFEKPLAN